MPLQFPPEGLFATMLFWSVAVPIMPMPPPLDALFPLMVLLLIVAVTALSMPPHANCALFPLMVLLLIVAVPPLLDAAADRRYCAHYSR